MEKKRGESVKFHPKNFTKTENKKKEKEVRAGESEER